MDLEFENKFLIAGYNDGGGGETRYPQDDPDGVTNQTDRSGNFIATGAVSLTEVEVLDAISEGEIEGLVTGNFVYSGNIGEIGYQSASAVPYPVAPGTSARWMRSVFWNRVPLVDSANKYNFSVIDVSWTPGYPNGEVISAEDQLTVTKSVGERLRGSYVDDDGRPTQSQNDDYIKVYRILNPNCVGLKLNVKFGALFSRNTTNEEYGDTERTSVEYTIEYRGIFSDGRTDGWSNPYKETVNGKLNFGYIKSSTVLFSDKSVFIGENSFLGWEIRVIRLTPDSISANLANQTFIDSYTEIYNNKFSYPNTAVVRSKFNAEYFSQVPERAFDVKLLKVLIPSNYDPILRTYSGDWDGTFSASKKWTDNPAWCYYDLLTNPRYGLGKYISGSEIDKWTLYKIAQYCDELVADGKGGLEPRFTCNLIINSKEEAVKVVNDFASVFRGIIYFLGGSIFVSQDRRIELDEATAHFTNANVEDGNFIYSTSPRKGRNTVCIVRYNDKNNFYQPAAEIVENEEGIKRFGRREFEITAFGATSQGQAIREAKNALYTQLNQFETINFVAGPEASLLRPGQIFKVTDNNRNYNRLGGRIISGNSGEFILDDNISGYFSGIDQGIYKISLTVPRYNYDPLKVEGLDSSEYSNMYPSYIQTRFISGQNISFDNTNEKTKITLSDPITLSGNSVNSYLTWTLDLATGVSPNFNSSEYWTTINIVPDDESYGLKHKIFGLKYDINKFGFIESGLKFESQIQSEQETGVGPSNLIVSGYKVNESQFNFNYSFLSNIGSNSQYTHLLLSKKDSPFTAADVTVTNYQPYVVASLPYNSTTGTYSVYENGTYHFRIYTINPQGLFLDGYDSATSGVSTLNYQTNYLIASLRLAGDRDSNTYADKISVNYTGASPEYNWQVGNLSSLVSTGIKFRITVREPSNNNTPADRYYYQETGYISPKPNTFNWKFDIDLNKSLPGGPYRNYDLVVESHNDYGDSSAGNNFSLYANGLGFGDSDYSRPQGYDILYAENLRITGTWLTQFGQNEASSLTSGAFHTSQGINADGSIFIKFLTGHRTIPDLAGGYLYYSNTEFTTGQAFSGSVPFVKFQVSNPINFYPSVINIPTTIDSSFTGYYIAYSLYDIFDNAADISRTGNFVSNIAQVARFGGATSSEAQPGYLAKFGVGNVLENSKILEASEIITINRHLILPSGLSIAGQFTGNGITGNGLSIGGVITGERYSILSADVINYPPGGEAIQTGVAGYVQFYISGSPYYVPYFSA